MGRMIMEEPVLGAVIAVLAFMLYSLMESDDD
jgi:hypothetical protein